MRIVLVRHGDPNYELDCLTELGHKQAEVAAKRLMIEEIDEVFSSPHGRAVQTAEYFSKLSGKQIQILEFMKEIRYGREGELYDKKWNPWNGADELVWSGQSLQTPDWREYPVFKGDFSTEDADKIGVETDKWLETLGYKREGLYYRNIRKDDEQKTVAIFNHGGASAAFIARVLNQPFPYMCELLHFAHTAISVLRFDKTPGRLTVPTIELLNDSRHLKDVQ